MDSKRLPLWMGALLGAGLCLSPATAVAQQRVADVQISPPATRVAVGGTVSFAALAYDRSSNPVSSATFVYTSSNLRVATVDQYGNATGVAPGTALITARTGTGHNVKSGRATLTVTGDEAAPQPQASAPPSVSRGPAPTAAARPVGQGCAAADREPPGSGPPTGLVVEPLVFSLVKGESRQLSFRPVQANSETADHVCVLFQTGGEKAATVDTFGVVLANDTGQAIIQVTVPGKNFPTKMVRVEVRGDSVKFRSREISMVPNTSDTLQLIVPAQGNRPVNTNGLFQFASNDTTKVRVNALAPIVTAVATGTARIVAQSTFYPDIPVIVNVHRRVVRFAGTPVDTLITVTMNGQTAVSVRALAGDSSPVTEVSMRWTVGDTTIAHYDTTNHVLRGLKTGETQLTVSVPAARDSLTSHRWRVKVIAGGLAISRPGPRVALGVGERLPVEVKVLDERRQPIETATRLSWTSTGDSIARVVDGQLVGVGMGHARLKATAVWDSSVTTDVTVVGELLVYALRGGRWDVYMLERGANGQPARARQMTQDTLIKNSAPAWSPTLMQIAYTAQFGTSGNSDLYVEDADGSNGRRLTHDSATVTSPAFVGPNGDQIVFESSKGGKAQIYVMKLDGTGRRQVTAGDNQNTQPSVSPDGRKVLFRSQRDKNSDIYEIGLDGTGERRLTMGPRPEDSPEYAADGHSFYYLREENDSPRSRRVYRQDLTSGVASPLTPEHMYVSSFSVSADGSTLALFILTQDATGTQTNRVLTFNVGTSVQTPVIVPGSDRVGGPVFRPQPQH